MAKKEKNWWRNDLPGEAILAGIVGGLYVLSGLFSREQHPEYNRRMKEYWVDGKPNIHSFSINKRKK